MTHYDKAIKHWGNHRKDRFTQQCSGYSHPSNFSSNANVIISKESAIIILSEMEKQRTKESETEKDFIWRIAQAIVAKNAGFKERNEWQECI